MDMISQQNLPVYIEKTLPELSAICEKGKGKSTYDLIREMLWYVKAKVAEHNIIAAKKCMFLTETLYKKGNVTIKNAIENVFIYSFSHAFFYDEKNRKEILNIVPMSLYEVYKRQVINSHL